MGSQVKQPKVPISIQQDQNQDPQEAYIKQKNQVEASI